MGCDFACAVGSNLPCLPKSATKALLSRIYFRTDSHGDGLVNRSTPPSRMDSTGNCTPLHRNGGFLTVSELADRLGWDTKTIYSLTRRRRANRGLLPLPHKKVGRKLYFEWDKVVEWLNRQPGVELPERGKQA